VAVEDFRIIDAAGSSCRLEMMRTSESGHWQRAAICEQMDGKARSAEELAFACPTTRQNVRHSREEGDELPEGKYHVVICPACGRLHFVNRKTGKLFGREGRKRPCRKSGFQKRQVDRRPVTPGRSKNLD